MVGNRDKGKWAPEAGVQALPRALTKQNFAATPAIAIALALALACHASARTKEPGDFGLVRSHAWRSAHGQPNDAA